ncbi:MAG TPA: hypothetical protein VM870_03005 [Pyrinomonadaceae bacterium]|nr:hypothetical protein [Pyrinomonadaceae bacterium]
MTQTLIEQPFALTPARRAHEMRERVHDCRRRVRQMRHHTACGAAWRDETAKSPVQGGDQEERKRNGCTS